MYASNGHQPDTHEMYIKNDIRTFYVSGFLNHGEIAHLTSISHSISYYTSMYTVRCYNFNHFGRNKFYCVKCMNEINYRR